MGEGATDFIPQVAIRYWDGSAWQKVTQGDLVGSQTIAEVSVSDLNLSAGTNTLYGTAVASGKVQKITVACWQIEGTAPTDSILFVDGLASGIVLATDYAPATANVWWAWKGETYLQEGDRLAVTIRGATAGDNAYLRYAGVELDAP